jgi:hypothetical protein
MKGPFSHALSLCLVAAFATPAAAAAADPDEDRARVLTHTELRNALDAHMSELRTMFPTLQGVGTSPTSGEIVLTIYSESSSPETEEEQTKAAEALLGAPVRLLVIPAKLMRQPTHP